MGASPITGPVDQTQMLQDLNDRLTLLEQTAIIPVGIVAYCAGPVPNGWLAMDGAALDSARYGQLVNYLNGATNLPDAEGRVLVGRNAATFATLLGTGGVETVQLTSAQGSLVVHNHAGGTTGGPSVASTGAGTAHAHGPLAASGGNFAHTNFAAQVAGGGAFGAVNSQATATDPESAHTHSMQSHTHTTPTVANSIGATASQAHTNLQPYLVLIPIIKF